PSRSRCCAAASDRSPRRPPFSAFHPPRNARRHPVYGTRSHPVRRRIIDVDEPVKDAARAAESSRVFRVLARGGFAANGAVHLLTGVLVLVAAFGGRGEADQAGALRAIASAPLGFVALWAIAVGLWALGAWHAAEGVLARGRSATQRWRTRISEWGQ